MSKYDVAHLTTVHVPTDNRIAMKECTALVRAGMSVCLIACGGPAPQVDGLSFIELPKQSNRIKRLVLGYRDAWRVLRDIRPKVLHVHDPELIPLAVTYKLRFRAESVYDAHEEFGKQIAGKSYIPRLLRKPVALCGHLFEGLANSTMDAIVVATAKIGARYHPAKVTLVQNYPWRDAFDTSYRADLPMDRNIAYVGAITLERGLREMIEAVDQCDPWVRLVLAGPAAGAAKQVIEDAPKERVKYCGQLPATEIPKVLADSFAGLAVLYALPNYVESQPTKVYEYMAAGRPFIASNFTRWVEEFGTCECGIFVDPTDVNQVREAIKLLASDRQLASSMGRRGRTEFLSRFTFDQEGAKLVALTQELLSGT